MASSVIITVVKHTIETHYLSLEEIFGEEYARSFGITVADSVCPKRHSALEKLISRIYILLSS
jgi:hypothetical protein